MIIGLWGNNYDHGLTASKMSKFDLQPCCVVVTLPSTDVKAGRSIYRYDVLRCALFIYHLTRVKDP